jgi:hypothetical protein
MFTIHEDTNGGAIQKVIALKARYISAMGVSPWFRCLELIPGFGRSGANREMKDSPKRSDCDFLLRFQGFFKPHSLHREHKTKACRQRGCPHSGFMF